ncbi:hypothetical protein [Streptomyces sp. V1I6]|uniref:hypothetical protein n=1 Tax=Streptomyces sp. V1I6 TaxID=3042273 RepID=UPI00277DBA2A|nr:hypothetical protein [Streptomyces sp. V1I6]MDQ0846325.1 hypothetical protein [Streptomyces sp. V1I6]
MLFCSPTRPGSRADITHARQSGPVGLLADGPAVEIRMHERQRKAHFSRRIRVEHGIAHLKNWRTLARREHMSDTVQAVAGLLSHQQTADLTSARQT